MDRPYSISDFAFPSRWDGESGPNLVERAGQAWRGDRPSGHSDRDKDSDSARSRRAFEANTLYAIPRFVR